jgi:exonuclease VII large subunit
VLARPAAELRIPENERGQAVSEQRTAELERQVQELISNQRSHVAEITMLRTLVFMIATEQRDFAELQSRFLHATSRYVAKDALSPVDQNDRAALENASRRYADLLQIAGTSPGSRE